MRIIVTAKSASANAGVFVAPVFSDQLDAPHLSEVDAKSGGRVAALRALGEVTGGRYVSVLTSAGRLPADHLLLVGAGARADFGRQELQRWAAAATRRLAGRRVTRIAVDATGIIAALTSTAPALRAEGGASFGPGLAADSVGPRDAAITAVDFIVRGVIDGSFHEGVGGKSVIESKPAPLSVLEIIVPNGTDVAGAREGARRGEIIAGGVARTRRWSNYPANEMPPLGIAEEARDRARAVGLRATIITAAQLKRMGAGMLLAVGKGSKNPPCLVVLSGGKPGAKDPLGRRLAMVGKGVCFDTGGISLKPPAEMEEMKHDKNGAIAVLEAAATVAQLDPGRPIHAVAACVENMPGGNATRPGDVVTALNGKRVEITNTDAEGRLILGDALHYAERELSATHLVDVATLTGIAYSAFGGEVAATCGTDAALLDEFHLAARRAGEVYWPYPLADAYVKNMSTWSADFQNSGSREASLIRSGLFLREFVTVPWVHLDIAGTAYRRSATPFAGRGSTGAAHTSLVELAMGGGVRR